MKVIISDSLITFRLNDSNRCFYGRKEDNVCLIPLVVLLASTGDLPTLFWVSAALLK